MSLSPRVHTPGPLALAALAVAVVALIAVAAWQLAGGGSHPNAAPNSAAELRLAARVLDDGRTEIALQQRGDNGWGGYITPNARFLRPDAELGDWYHSSPITLADQPVGPGPLKIAMLQTIHGAAVERRRAFRLAIADINAAGGVFGQPVIGVIADFNLDKEFIVASARRLVEEDGVHAFVGPTFSSSALVITEQISIPLRIPTVSPSATSPLLTTADTGDFFFRTTPSDGQGQGLVLAEYASTRGHSRIGIVYRNDAYGRGLAEEVVRSFPGDAIALPIDHEHGVTFLPQIEQVAANGATLLMVLACSSESAIVISESLDSGRFDEFVLGDCGQSTQLFETLGAEIASRLTGTAPSFAEHNDSTRFFVRRYTETHGEPPSANITFVPSVYDAAISLALAAQAAQSTDGEAIRDQLRTISDGQGIPLTADRLPEALNALANGQAIDYSGAVSSLDWDDYGDITRFTIGIWRFTSDGAIEITEHVDVDLER